MALVRCPECSQGIGEVYCLFVSARNGMVKKAIEKKTGSKATGYDMRRTELNTDYMGKLGDILDAIGLTNMCCRTHVMTLRKFNSPY